MDFVDRLYELIRLKNTKQIALAEYCGIAQNTISGWKRQGVLPRADIAVRMADFLGVSVEYLVTGKDRTIPEFRDSEREIIKEMHDLDDNELKTVLVLVHGLAENRRIDDRQKQTAG
jgi:transcriptional regulator with XRE-family HTH domain